MPEAYRELDAQYFRDMDIDLFVEEFVEQYGHEPSTMTCSYYPESCRRCKIRSRCKESL